MGRDRIVGVTCHDSRHLAIEAAEAGADYVAFGAFFPTTTKDATIRADPEILEIWQQIMTTPVRRHRRHHRGQLPPPGRRRRRLHRRLRGGLVASEGPAAAVAAFNAAIAAGLAERPHAG